MIQGYWWRCFIMLAYQVGVTLFTTTPTKSCGIPTSMPWCTYDSQTNMQSDHWKPNICCPWCHCNQQWQPHCLPLVLQRPVQDFLWWHQKMLLVSSWANNWFLLHFLCFNKFLQPSLNPLATSLYEINIILIYTNNWLVVENHWRHWQGNITNKVKKA